MTVPPPPAPEPLPAIGPARVALLVAALLGPLMVFGAILTFGNSRQSSTGRVGIGLMVAGGLTMLLSGLVAGILVIVWLDRAAQLVGGYATGRVSRGLLIGGWFIPIGNLFLPAQQVSALVRAAGAGGPDDRGAGLAPGVGRWWGLWLGGSALFDVGWSLFVSLTAARTLSPGAGQLVLLVSVLAAVVCLVLAALSLVRVLRRIAEPGLRGSAAPHWTGQPMVR